MLRDEQNQCPCCDFYSLARRSAYDVCPVCYWEDDGTDLDRIDDISSANHLSLFTARHNFNSFGASDQAALSLVATPEQTSGLRREQRATYH